MFYILILIIIILAMGLAMKNEYATSRDIVIDKPKVEVYEYKKSVLHGKISVCDSEWVTVGSYNLNELSAKASVELNIDVNNPAFGRIVNTKLQHIISTDCKRISHRTNSRTGAFDRMIQLLAFQLCRLILFLFTFYFKQHRINYRRSSE